MRILVTGAAGFIGSHVCRQAAQVGHEVVGVDLAGQRMQQVRADRLISDLAVEIHQMDILDAEPLGDIDAVIHLAARPGVRSSFLDPDATWRTNVDGTRQVLDVWGSQADHVLFVSSSSVYGPRSGPTSEDAQLGPQSPYAESKVAGEELVESWSEQTGTPAAIVRPYSVYGPEGRPDMAPLRFLSAAVSGEPVPLYGDGAQRRDFSFVSDIADAMLAASSGRRTGIYNLGHGEPASLLDLIGTIEHVVGAPVPVDSQPPAPGDLPCTWADNRRAREDLAPITTGLKDGVRALFEWWQGEPERSAWDTTPVSDHSRS